MPVATKKLPVLLFATVLAAASEPAKPIEPRVPKLNSVFPQGAQPGAKLRVEVLGEFIDRAHAEQAIQRFNGQIFNGRPLAVSEARAREDRGPGGPPRPGGYSSGPPRPGGFAPRPPGSFGGSRPFDSGSSMPGSVPGRSRNFGPDAKPQRGGSAKGKKKGDDKPRGPIPLKNTGRSFSLDDVDAPDEAIPEMDDIATSKPQDETDKDEES